MYKYFAYMHVCALYTYLVPVEAKVRHRITGVRAYSVVTNDYEPSRQC